MPGNSIHRKLWRGFLLGSLFALGLGAAALIGVNYLSDRQLINFAHLQRAHAHVQEVLSARHWDSNYGGAAVEKRPGGEIAPYLKNADLETAAGSTPNQRRLAGINRERADPAASDASYTFRLSSFKPINPSNAPTPWEQEALGKFAAATSKEAFAYSENGSNTIFRYIAPVYIKPACLPCHQALGYQLGDLGGGISVSFDVSAIDTVARKNSMITGWIFLLVFSTVGALIYRQTRGTETRVRALGKQADEARARFEGLVQSTDGIVWEADASSLCFTFVSAHAEQMLGFPVEDWYQPGFWVDHLHPDDRKWAPGYCASCTARLESHDFDYRFIASDGRTVWLHDLVSVISEDGKPKWLRGLMIDITARKLADTTNLSKQAEQKALLDNALVGIVHIRHRVMITCNPKMEQLFGYAPGELIGQSTRLLYPDEATFREIGEIAYDTIGEIAAGTIGEGRSFSGEAPLVRKDGTPFWGALSGKALDPARPQEGSIWIYADISDRKMAEQEAEKLLRAVEQSPVSIVITNPQGIIEYVNPRFTEVSGYSAAEVIGQNPRLLQSGETPRATYHRLWSTLLRGGEWKGVLHNRRKNGELFWESVSIAPMLDDAGDIVHFVAVKEDITEQRKNEEELSSHRESLENKVVLRTRDLVLAMEKAKAAERAKSEFLTQMSHEIRTPMNAIIGFSQLLARTSLSEKQQDYVAKIDGASKHLLELINNVLDLSKIAAGKIKAIENEFSLTELVARLSSVVGYRAAEKSLSLRTELADGVPDRLLGDSLRLNQVLMNLLSNAIKFTESGEVSLRIGLADQSAAAPVASSYVALQFLIADSGIGMSEEEQERVFDPFTQADESITRKYGGSGLGLPISRELVTLLGGNLVLDSRKGHGSTFSFTLSFKTLNTGTCTTGGRPHPEQDASPPYRFENVRVLLAEDQVLNQQVAVELMEHVGIQVRVVNNGQQALDELFGANGTSFDLVLMDIQMPVLDGISAMRAIRARKELAGLPIVAITAHVLAEEKQQGLAAGANDHLGKPFMPEALYSTIAAWISPHKVSRLRDMPATTKQENTVRESDSILDTQAGLSRFAGKIDKYKTWLCRFADEKKDLLAAFMVLFEQGDLDALARQVHALKGLAGTLGLSDTFAACQTVEQACRSAEAASRVPATLQQLGQAMKQALAAIAEFTAAVAPPLTPALAAGTPPSGATRTETPSAEAIRRVDSLAEQLRQLCQQLTAGSGDSGDNADDCLRRAREIGNAEWMGRMAEVVDRVRVFDFAGANAAADALRLAMLGTGTEKAGG